MRRLAALILCLLPLTGFAQDWEDRRIFGDPDAEHALRVLSSTDTSFFAPVIDQFLLRSPNLTIEYLVTGTADLDRIFRQDPNAFDVVVSSAMDLQLKLANDGFALRLNSVQHPDWAHWRQSVFGFTSEPAAIVLNISAFSGGAIPSTRQDLITALRGRPEVFRGKLGTYDVRRSGLGYLFATQDARASETFWRLTEVMGGLGTRLYCCSGDMIDDLLNEDILVAYNVLNSYAAGRLEDDPRFAIVLPSDFPTTMMRTALVSKDSQTPEIAADFIAHLIRIQSGAKQDVLTLPPLDIRQDQSEFAAIPLEPSLLTYLDALKRRTFIAEWQNAILQDR